MNVASQPVNLTDMPWPIPELPPVPAPPAPRAGRWFAALLLANMFTTLLTLLLWPTNTPRFTASFWFLALGAPALLWLLSLALRGIVWVIAASWVRSSNAVRSSTIDSYHRWAQQRIALLGSAVITPEQELVPRLTGQKSPAPHNPGQALPLAEIDHPNRPAQLLTSILTKLAPALNQLDQAVNVHLWCPSKLPPKTLAATAQHIWADTQISPSATIQILSQLPSRLPTSWFSAEQTGAQLLVMLQLSAPDTPPTQTEAGCALLFLPSSAAKHHTPQAWLYRDMPSDKQQVPADLQTMLALQAPLNNAKTMWLAGLAQPEQNAVLAAAGQALDLADDKGVPAMYLLDPALGRCGALAPWLALALAAESLSATPSPTLIAAPFRSSLSLHLLCPVG